MDYKDVLKRFAPAGVEKVAGRRGGYFRTEAGIQDMGAHAGRKVEGARSLDSKMLYEASELAAKEKKLPGRQYGRLERAATTKRQMEAASRADSIPREGAMADAVVNENASKPGSKRVLLKRRQFDRVMDADMQAIASKMSESRAAKAAAKQIATKPVGKEALKKAMRFALTRR